MRTMPTRRILLKTTAKLAATSAFALNRTTLARANLLGDAATGTLPEVDAVLRTAVSAEDVPGVVAMAATEAGVVYEGVFGSRRLREGPPMTRATVFRIASMVKLITSVAALRLVEQGKLSLEAPVPNIDPMIPAPQVLDGFGSFFGFHLGGLCLNSAHEFAAPEPNSLGAADRLAFCRRRLGRFAKAVSAVGEKRAIDARRAGTI